MYMLHFNMLHIIQPIYYHKLLHNVNPFLFASLVIVSGSHALSGTLPQKIFIPFPPQLEEPGSIEYLKIIMPRVVCFLILWAQLERKSSQGNGSV